MFESLSERLSETLRGLSGKSHLSEENISAALRDVRMALLEADVALPVVKEFTEHVKGAAVGTAVVSALNPGEAFIKIVRDELVHVMGDANDALNSEHQAAGHRAHGRPAGCGQDDHRGQARPALERAREEEGRRGQRRRLSTGGHRAAEDAGR